MKKPIIPRDQRKHLYAMNSLMQYYILGDDGQPRKASFLRSSAWLGEGKNQIALTYLFDKAIKISTVFLPFGHNFMRRITGKGQPLLFETMIFGNTELDQGQWRYATLEDALLGHMEITELAKSRGIGFSEEE